MRNIGKHNNCNDETREELEPKLPERQKEDVIHKTVSQSHGGHRTALLRFDATEMTHKNKSALLEISSNECATIGHL